MIYHILCEKHKPLKLRRTLETQEKKLKDELDKFFKLAEKFCSTMASLHNQRQKQIVLNETITTDMNSQQKKRGAKKEDMTSYLNLVKKYKEIASKISDFELSKNNKKRDFENSFLIKEENKTIKSIISETMLTVDDEVWKIMPYKNLTPEQKYNKYKRICTGLKQENKIKDFKRNTEKEIYINSESDYSIEEVEKQIKEKKKRIIKKNKEKKSTIR